MITTQGCLDAWGEATVSFRFLSKIRIDYLVSVISVSIYQ